MKLNHVSAIIVSGVVWLFVGIMLLTKGLSLIVLAAHFSETPSTFISWFGGGEQAALLLISAALIIGFVKGRFVLSKSVDKVSQRILSFPSPVHLRDLYDRRYYILIASMMFLGLLMKWLPINGDVRGFIDVAIGSALINGAILYFRQAVSLRRA